MLVDSFKSMFRNTDEWLKVFLDKNPEAQKKKQKMDKCGCFYTAKETNSQTEEKKI
jgi:hypothetical protein